MVKLGVTNPSQLRCLLASVMIVNKAAKPSSLDPPDIVPALRAKSFPDQ
jgi:hypothetical protein